MSTFLQHIPALLFVSDVRVSNELTGGNIVLWRHLHRLEQLQWREARQPLCTPRPWLIFLWRWGPQLHLQRLLLILQPLLLQLGTRLDSSLVHRISSQHQLILTVAHGTRWLEAMALARKTGLPLATIFHDWYPDASGCMAGLRWFWNRAFRQLHRRSALAFYVSEGMSRELGPHRNGLVLPPIPAELGPASNIPTGGPHSVNGSPDSVINLYYSGLAGGMYRRSLTSLVQAVSSDSRFRLHISGSESETLGPILDSEAVQLSGILDGDAWRQAFASADVLLVLLPFERCYRRHLRTHFPSKLIEYANRMKPIAIWGPASSSSVLWASHEQNTLAVSNPDPRALLEALPCWLTGLQHSSSHVRFNPDSIHQAFESSLLRLVRRP